MKNKIIYGIAALLFVPLFINAYSIKIITQTFTEYKDLGQHWNTVPDNICSIDSKSVTSEELLTWILIEKKTYTKCDVKEFKTFLNHWVKEYIKFRIEYFAAQKQFPVTDRQKKEILKAREAKYNSWKDKPRGLTYPEWVKKLKLNLNIILQLKAEIQSVNNWKKSIHNSVHIPKKNIKDYYLKNKRKFYTTESFKLHHIIFRCDIKNEKECKKTEEKAKKVFEELKNGGDFVELVHKYSEDETSRKADGYIGKFHNNQILPEIEEICFELAKNRLNEYELVKDRLGFEIIKITEYNPFKYKTLKEVKLQIIKHLKKEAYNKNYLKQINAAKIGKKIIINKYFIF